MKQLLAVAFVLALYASAVRTSPTTTTSDDQSQEQQQQQQKSSNDVSLAAVKQLQRLAHFPRSGFLLDTATNNKQQLQQQQQHRVKSGKSRGRSSSSNQLQSSTNSVDDSSTTTLEIPIDLTELLRIIGEGSTANGNSKSNGQITAKQMLALDRYADKIMKDERVMSYVQDRIKRDHTTGYDYAPPPPRDSYGPPAPVYGPPPAQHHGGGSDSASFFTGLVGGLIGSSASLSKGSVVASAQGSHAPPALPQHHPVVYGPPAPVYAPPKYPTYGHHEHHEHHQVTPWDLKKAIINSLIQAVKAVGGGFLALNGQIIKGSGFLVQTKGRLISGAGEAISGLGKTLATGATKPTTQQHHHTTSYEHHGYAYGPPPVVHNHYAGHDHHYAGAPPPTDSYQHGFGAATDVVYAYAYYPPVGGYKKYTHIG